MAKISPSWREEGYLRHNFHDIQVAEEDMSTPYRASATSNAAENRFK